MKILSLLILTASFSVAQTQGEKMEAEKRTLASHLGTGCEMARLSFIASGGAIRNNVQDHQVYSKGAIMGLTREEALSKFEEIWAASPASVRMNWARKAMMSGATAGSQQAARQSKATEDAAAEARNAARRAANQRIIDRLETDQRFRDIEKKLR
jgi:hypothetical protein